MSRVDVVKITMFVDTFQSNAIDLSIAAASFPIVRV